MATAGEKETKTAAKSGDSRVSPTDTEALQKAGLSAADLELATPLAPTGESRIVKARPEMPTTSEVGASEQETGGPPVTNVTLEIADGEPITAELPPDEHAAITQRVLALQAHPSFAQPGYWSNPNLVEPTDEEKEADQKAYASRFGGG